MKTAEDQIRDLEENIARLQDASKRLFVLGDGGAKRFLDESELKSLAQLSNAETRAHNELAAIRREQKGKTPEMTDDELEAAVKEWLSTRKK